MAEPVVELSASQPEPEMVANLVKDEDKVREAASQEIQATGEGNKNQKHIKCPRCPSTILTSDMAVLVSEQFVLPPMARKLERALPFDTENVEKYWRVDNMYTFENIGFSKNVGDIKYLICADCEVGPIGYHSLGTKLSYVSADRVKYC